MFIYWQLSEKWNFRQGVHTGIHPLVWFYNDNCQPRCLCFEHMDVGFKPAIVRCSDGILAHKMYLENRAPYTGHPKMKRICRGIA
jgi:hypothetical protein